MTAENQIEEMACKKCLHYEDCLKRFREAKEVLGMHALIDEEEYFGYIDDCDMFITGCRKASSVAEEIFAEIEEMLNTQAMIVCKTRETASDTDEPVLSFIAMLDGRIYSLRVVEEHIAELKKKYTEDKR